MKRELQVNTNTQDAQQNPSVALLKDGSFIIVWESRERTNGLGGIYGQQFSADSSFYVRGLFISASTEGYQTKPKVVPRDNGFTVVWQDNARTIYYSPMGQSAIIQPSLQFRDSGYLTKIADSTAFIKDYHLKDGCSAISHLDPAVTSIGVRKENLLIVYESYCVKEDAHESGLYAALIFYDGGSSNSTHLSTRNLILKINGTETPGVRMHPVVAAINPYNAVIVWEMYTKGSEMKDIYVKKMNSTHNVLEDVLRINTYTLASQHNPSIALLRDKSLVAAWESYGQDGSVEGIYGQKLFIDASGAIRKEGEEFRANSYTANAQKNPAVAALDNGGFVIGWDSRGQDGSVEGIFAQQFFKNTTKDGAEIQLNLETNNAQTRPTLSGISINGIDGYVAAWMSRGQNGEIEEIYTRSFVLNQTLATRTSESRTESPTIKGSITESMLITKTPEYRISSITPTKSNTRSVSFTASQTPVFRTKSFTSSQSLSRTPSKSLTRSKSQTRGPTRSITVSASSSRSITTSPTHTPKKSLSISSSNTGSMTSSITDKKTRTPSATRTFSTTGSMSTSLSATATNRNTKTITSTRTQSSTLTRSKSQTRVLTHSITVSSSNSRSITTSPTHTPKKSLSISSTNTGSMTSSMTDKKTRTPSATRTFSTTGSMSISLSATATSRNTKTITNTNKQSSTFSVTDKRTVSRSATRSLSPTYSNSLTSSMTATKPGTKTKSDSYSLTSTTSKSLSSTSTRKPTFTKTTTGTISRSPTRSLTATKTLTNEPTSCSFTIFNNSPYQLNLGQVNITQGAWSPTQKPAKTIPSSSSSKFILVSKKTLASAIGKVTYIAQNHAQAKFNTKFDFYCSNTNGMANAMLSNPIPNVFESYFTCSFTGTTTTRNICQQYDNTKELYKSNDLKANYYLSKPCMVRDINLGNMTKNVGVSIFYNDMLSNSSASSFGYSVTGLGDINNDGYGEVAVGIPGMSPFGRFQAGMTYVIFGNPDFQNLNISIMKTPNTFKIFGAFPGDKSGVSVSGIISSARPKKIVIGAPSASPNGMSYAGSSYIISLKSVNVSDIDLRTYNPSSMTILNGIKADAYTGYSVSGLSKHGSKAIIGAPGRFTPGSGRGAKVGRAYLTSDNLLPYLNMQNDEGNGNIGTAVSGIGDINKDGYDDIIISAFTASPLGRGYAGASYVVFGRSGGFNEINLPINDTSWGFSIAGNAPEDVSGYSVSGAFDFNRDGYNDFIIGAPGASPMYKQRAGETYVILGKKEGFTDIDLSTLQMPMGFKIMGAVSRDESGYAVSGAGDINGDGFDDIIVGAPKSKLKAGKVHAIFGGKHIQGNIDLSNITHSIGFTIEGMDENDLTGFSVSKAMDVNGDGYNDIVIGAPGAFDATGSSYIVFGSPSFLCKDSDEGKDGKNINNTSTTPYYFIDTTPTPGEAQYYSSNPAPSLAPNPAPEGAGGRYRKASSSDYGPNGGTDNKASSLCKRDSYKNGTDCTKCPTVKGVSTYTKFLETISVKDCCMFQFYPGVTENGESCNSLMERYMLDSTSKVCEVFQNPSITTITQMTMMGLSFVESEHLIRQGAGLSLEKVCAT